MRKIHIGPSDRWHTNPLWTGTRLATLALVAVLAMTGLGHAAGAPTVNDRAGLFSRGAVSEANQTLERIYKNTQKQVFVETLPSLPAGQQADELAAAQFRERGVDGMLMLVVKDPHKLAITVGRTTQARFHDAEGVRRAMLDRFRHDDYDGGLLAGLRVVEPAFTQEFRPGAVAPIRAQRERAAGTAESERSGIGSWAWLLLLGGGGLLAYLFWRQRRSVAMEHGYGSPTQAGPLAGPGYHPGVGAGGVGYPGQVGSGGGGIGRSLIGGAAGAVAGSWLYDRFFRDHDGNAHAGPSSGFGSDDGPHQESDHGDVGSTFGGDGDGADWGGGGDDSAGADW